jgi:hypothetical protein
MGIANTAQGNGEVEGNACENEEDLGRVWEFGRLRCASAAKRNAEVWPLPDRGECGRLQAALCFTLLSDSLQDLLSLLLYSENLRSLMQSISQSRPQK